MQERLPSRRVQWGMIVAFFAVALCTYAPALHNEFVNFDDGLLIYNNPISQGLTLKNLSLAFTSYDPELYIPLTFVSYQLNYLVGGLHPFVYHLTNILLHAGNALLVSWVVLMLLRRHGALGSIPALITGILFLVHPLNVEAVAWAAARKDLLASFFFLLSLAGFLMSREGPKKWYYASIVFFACALLSKVSAIMLPVVIVLIDWAQGRAIFRKRTAIELLPYGVLCAIFAAIAIGGKIGSGSLMLEKILIGCKATVFYLGNIFLPIHLSVLYPYTQPIHLTTPDLLASVIIVVVITIGCLITLKKSRVPLALWAYFLLMILPSFGNIAKGQETYRDIYFASDRYAYLASMSILLLIGLIFAWAYRRWKAPVLAFFVALVAIAALAAFHQTTSWHDTETLFSHVIKHYPNAQLAHNYVGSHKFERGDLSGALEEYEKSLKIRPNDLGFFNKGVVLEKQGNITGAIEAYRGAIAINPIAIDARINLGVILLNAGQNAEAAQLFREAVDAAPMFTGVRDVKPLLVLAYFNLGVANEAMGKKDEAIQAYQKVLEIDPNDAETREKVRVLVR